jgi:hypothetical protein
MKFISTPVLNVWRPWMLESVSVGHQDGEVHVGRGRVGTGDFQVAAPLEAEIVDGGIGDSGIPVRHEDALVEEVAAIGAQGAVVG